MRLAGFFLLLTVLSGISAAQDTNFSAGPQYLVTTGSPLFLRPIATPSLSLGAPLPSIPSLPQIGPVVSDQPYVPVLNQPNLFPIFYGYPMVFSVEVTSSEPTRELPPSINDTGFVNVPSAQSLRQMGYGVSLGDTAAFWKSHKPRAVRVYTNSDIDRLHSS